MSGPVAAMLPGGRLHLQHGPIDLVIGVSGAANSAYRAATARFRTVLEELVTELTILRQPVGPDLRGSVAKRMRAATQPHVQRAFITPMAAVAGSVADEVLAAMRGAEGLNTAYVNNGGDIALWLAPGQTTWAGVAGLDGAGLATIELRAEDGIGGIATSGRGGRSLSLGIADSATVLAANAADADAAATLIANAIDLPGHPHITRQPASEIESDSDLGDRLVVVACGTLRDSEIDTALARGQRVAAGMVDRRLIRAAFLRLMGRTIEIGTRKLEFADA